MHPRARGPAHACLVSTAHAHIVRLTCVSRVLPRRFSGSRASSTRGQAPLCPDRRPPRPQHPIVSVFRRGGLHFGRHTNQSHARTATKWGELRCERCTVELTPRRGRHQTGGNCTNRGATRRRHAGRMLLMVQNPHRQPDIHPGAEGVGPEAAGALRDTGLATAPAGSDPTTSKQISHVISSRSLFEIARKRCNSNDVDSTFELIAGELRAILMCGAGTRVARSATTLAADQAKHPIGDHSTRSDRAQYSRSG